MILGIVAVLGAFAFLVIFVAPLIARDADENEDEKK